MAHASAEARTRAVQTHQRALPLAPVLDLRF